MPDLFLITVFTSSLVSGGVVWLLRTWITERLQQSIRHEYNCELETFKAQSKAAADTQIEKLRSQLQITAAERSTRYTRTFDETAKTIANCYALLIPLNDALGQYMSAVERPSDPPKAERRAKVGREFDAFIAYYRPRKIYVPKTTALRLDSLLKDFKKNTLNFLRHVEQPETEGYDPDPDKSMDVWSKADEYCFQELPKIIEELEDHFRELLAIHVVVTNKQG